MRDLQAFKSQTTSSSGLYERIRKKVRRYRIVFLLIGLFFIVLAWLIWMKSSLWITFHIKPFIDLIALFLGLASLTIAACLRYETEAIRALYHEEVHRLRHTYDERQAKALKNHDTPIVELIRKKLSLRAHYTQTLSKLRKDELETLRLMKKITHTKSLTLPEKENLYNQALAELREQFEATVRAYEEL